MLFCAIAAGIYFYRTATRNAVESLVKKKQLVGVLIAGGNRFNDHRHRFYALMAINPDTRRAGVVFLPPAMEIDLEDDGNGVRLETIDIRDFDDMADALHKGLRVRPQFHASIYPPDVRRAVDILEGMKLFLPEPLENVYGSVFGENILDGTKTVGFINSSSESIYKKYDRIQDIMLTLFDNREAFRPFMNRVVAKELRRNVRTNMLENEMVSVARLLAGCERIRCINLPGQMSAEGTFFTDEVAFKLYEDTFLKWLIVDEKSAPNIRVRILNATDVSGLAKRTRTVLMREGITVVEFGTSSVTGLEKSLIINNKGSNEDIALIAELTGISEIRNSVNSTELFDATIMIGKDMIK